MPAENARLIAAQTLYAIVYKGQSAGRQLTLATRKLTDRRDQGLVQELVYGACRWYFRLDAIAGKLLRKPLRKQDGDVHCALLLGLYQLLHTRVAQHAAISETVELARALGKPWASGVINGVLRNFLRQQDALLARVDSVDAARFSLPSWLWKQLKNDWPNQAVEIAEQSNHHPPLSLRVNQKQLSRAQYLASLHEAGIAASSLDYTEFGVILDQACDVQALPGFAEGQFSVQDAGAQLAAPLLDVHPGQRVLDACAAPGGKTCHILEQVPGCDLLALDIDEERAQQIQANFNRLGLQAPVAVGDAAAPAEWWDGVGFDRILLDAPCSGSGVLRRHPDIKLLRKHTDIPELVHRQQAILKALWPLLNRGGKLLYVTCSILKDENERQLAAFVSEQADAQVLLLPGPWGIEQSPGRQILTGENQMDGFYYGCIQKTI